MANKVLALLMVVAVAGVALGSLWLMAPGDADASGHSATRSFSATSVDPGGTVTVTIVARDYGRLGRIVETVPDGFTTSDGGQTETIRLLSDGPQTVTYTVTATDRAGSHSFSGTFTDEGKEERSIGGATTVTITAPPSTPEPTVTPPPDTEPSAARSFSATSVDPGGTVTVTIQANNYGRLGRVVETLPAGFTSPDASDQTVTLRLLQAGPQTLRYTVTVSDNPGPYNFSGVLESEDKSKTQVGGPTTVTVNAPPAPPGPSARRSFSTTSVDPGGTVTVTIRANNYGRLGRVVETLPSGFTSPDASGQTVTIRLLSAGPQTSSYTVTASDTPGSYPFSGVLESEDKSETTVGGSSIVRVVAPPPVEPVTPPPNTRPVFRSAAAFNVAENTTAVGRVIATDRDSQDTVTGYSIRGGADSGKFSIVAATGALSFTTAPDFENPADAGANNEYVVLVRAASGDGAAGRAMTTTQAITVTVTDVNEEPTFAGETADREVRENSAEGAPVGAPVAATDADAGDTLTYSLGGTDAASFAIDSATGQLMTMAPLDYETMMIYMVMVQVSDNEDDMGNADTAVDDSIAVTINVTNMEEMGEVTFSAQPVVGTEVTASVTDPDVVDQDTVTWQWASSDAMDGTFTDIADATDASYMPVAGDEDMYLQATATYEDGEGSSRNAMAVSEIVVSHSSPAFAEDAATAIDVAEDTAVGGNVGDPYTATDGDGDTPVYALSGADAASFTIDSMGQLMTVAALDYETTMTYMVTVEVRDDEDATGAPITGEDADAMVDVTINVTNVEEPGTVTLDSDQPVADTALMATLDDPDGGVTGVTWQWASSDAMDGTFDDIAGAMSDTYTPAAGDAGMYLMVTASYTDAEGPNKSAEAVSANAVTATPTTGTGSVVGDRYDANGDGVIQKSEAIAAVFDYFDRKIDKPDAIEVIMLYIANS